jgi:predicted nucleotidyltransferase
VVEVRERVMALAQDVARLERATIAPDARVILFGSCAKGTAVPRSDLDIAISTGAPIRPAKLVRVEDAIEDLRTLRRVDLLDLATAGDELRAEVLANGIEL